MAFESFPITHLIQRDSRFVYIIRSGIDSVSKSRAIANSVKLSTADNETAIFRKLFYAIVSAQFGKYIFERFLINSKDANSAYKNASITICILLYSSGIIAEETFDDNKVLFTSSLILLFGNIMDKRNNSGNIAKSVKSRKQGRN